MSNRITKKSTRRWIFSLTTLVALLLPFGTADAQTAPTVAPTQVHFEATSVPKSCNDETEFSKILYNWVPPTGIRADAARHLNVRIRRSPTGGKLVDVTLEGSDGTVLDAYHDRAGAKAECYKILYEAAYNAAKLMGALQQPPPPVPCPVCPACPPLLPPPAPAVCPAPRAPEPTLPKLDVSAPKPRIAAVPRRAYVGIGASVETGVTPDGAVGPRGLLGYVLSAHTPRIQLEFGGAWLPQSLALPNSPHVLPVQTVPLFGSLCYSRYLFRICTGMTTTFYHAERRDLLPGHDELRNTLAMHLRMGTEVEIAGPFSMRIDAFAQARFWQRTFGVALASLDAQSPFGVGAAAMGVWSFE